MNPRFNERFFENTIGLENEGAIAYSSIDQSTLRIDNLNRRLAVFLAHELTKRLDALGSTGAAYNDTNYGLANSITEADMRYFGQERVVFSSTPAHGNYVVEVKLPERTEMERIGLELGKYTVMATVAKDKDEIRDETSAARTRNTLQEGYESLLNRVDFFPSEEQQDIERQLISLGVPVRADTRKERQIFEEQEATEVQNVERILRNIGVKDINLEELTELREIKKWDARTVIDLYLEVITDKQEKGHSFPQISLRDLAQQTTFYRTSEARETKEDIMAHIRKRQEGRMERRFKKIGLGADEVKSRYDFYEGDENSRLAFRFASWLISRDIMAQESAELAKRIGMGESFPNPKLFREVTASVYRVYQKFQEDRHDNYNLSVDWQKQDYQEGIDYLKNLILLCLNIFYGKDISEFRAI